MPEWYKPKKQVDEERLEAEANRVRRERDRLLRESDYTVLPDVPVDDTEAWKDYRKALRDVPQQDGFPYDIEWPRKPSY